VVGKIAGDATAALKSVYKRKSVIFSLPEKLLAIFSRYYASQKLSTAYRDILGMAVRHFLLVSGCRVGVAPGAIARSNASKQAVHAINCTEQGLMYTFSKSVGLQHAHAAMQTICNRSYCEPA
jgi:hypothetical protein